MDVIHIAIYVLIKNLTACVCYGDMYGKSFLTLVFGFLCYYIYIYIYVYNFTFILLLIVRYHCGGWPEEVNTCFLNSYMVYL